MIKRVIFDLDNTLIPWLEEWDGCARKTFDYFNIPFEEDDFKQFTKARLEYEDRYIRFDKVEMSKYINDKIDKDIPDNFVDVWTGFLSELVPPRDDKLIILLEYLSSKYSLVVITNWFMDQQSRKLEKYEILKYFDYILSCDKYDRKPYKEMYDIACEGFNKEEVVMVGDKYSTDIKSAMDYGIYSYYLTSVDRRRSKRFKVIKEIYDLKEYL